MSVSEMTAARQMDDPTPDDPDRDGPAASEPAPVVMPAVDAAQWAAHLRDTARAYIAARDAHDAARATYAKWEAIERGDDQEREWERNKIEESIGRLTDRHWDARRELRRAVLACSVAIGPDAVPVVPSKVEFDDEGPFLLPLDCVAGALAAVAEAPAGLKPPAGD